MVKQKQDKTTSFQVMIKVNETRKSNCYYFDHASEPIEKHKGHLLQLATIITTRIIHTTSVICSNFEVLFHMSWECGHNQLDQLQALDLIKLFEVEALNITEARKVALQRVPRFIYYQLTWF